jgi:hypothetical protein
MLSNNHSSNRNYNKNSRYNERRFKNLDTNDIKKALDEELDLISKNQFNQTNEENILSLSLPEKDKNNEKKEEQNFRYKSRTEKILSDEKDFHVEIFSPKNNDEPYKFFYSKEAKYYIISEKNNYFQIRMTDNRIYKKPFGATLFIDGKEIQKIKTCYKTGVYFGFKQGNGKYNLFQFVEPDVDVENFNNNNNNNPPNNQNINSTAYDSDDNYDDNNYYNKFGTIEIKFYDTFQRETYNLEKEFMDFKTYEPNKREINKKFVLRNQTVKKGEEIYVPNKFNYDHFYNKNTGRYVENRINFEKKIDHVIIYYQDFLAMNILGLVKYHLLHFNIFNIFIFLLYFIFLN